MAFVIIGVLVVICHLVGVGPMANWTWNVTGDLWKFCAPFVLAALWWAWADASGLNKRREIERMERRKQDRRRENLEALGLGPKAGRKPGSRR